MEQALRWGVARYWLEHLLARVKTGTVLARDSDVERPCYEAGRAAGDDFD